MGLEECITLAIVVQVPLLSYKNQYIFFELKNLKINIGLEYHKILF